MTPTLALNLSMLASFVVGLAAALVVLRPLAKLRYFTNLLVIALALPYALAWLLVWFLASVRLIRK